MPIMNFKRWKLEQPWFGANYISGVLLPVPGGGLMRNGQVKLTFSEGGEKRERERERRLIDFYRSY